MLAISVEIAESRSSPRGVSNLTVVVLPGAFILFRRTILERQPPKALDVGQLDGPGLLPPFGVRRIRVVTRDCTLNPFRRPVTDVGRSLTTEKFACPDTTSSSFTPSPSVQQQPKQVSLDKTRPRINDPSRQSLNFHLLQFSPPFLPPADTSLFDSSTTTIRQRPITRTNSVSEI